MWRVSDICCKLKSRKCVCVCKPPQWRPPFTMTAVLIWPSLSSLIKLSLSDHLILMAGFIRLFSLLNTELKQFHTILETILRRILIMVGKYSDSMQSLVVKLHFGSLGIKLPKINFLWHFHLCILRILMIIKYPNALFYNFLFETACLRLCMLVRHVPVVLS